MDHPKVFDMNYQEQSWQWAVDKYSVAYRRAEVAAGQKVYRLVKLQEKSGHHSIIVQVLDANGRPVEKARPTFYWPDAPEFPFASPHDWYRNFIACETNLAGECSPGAMGKGAWIDVDPETGHAIGGGPHAVWIHHSDIPSDICEKLGMRGGTNHDHLDLLLQEMVAGEPEEPPEEPGEPEPPEEPEEPCGWTMTVDAQSGIPLLIGKGLPAGTPVIVTAPWGHSVTVEAGSKEVDHGAGGWEVNIWHPAIYKVSFIVSPCREPCEFDVAVENCTVTCTFAEGPPPPPKAHLASDSMDLSEAEKLLGRLAAGGFADDFTLVRE